MSRLTPRAFPSEPEPQLELLDEARERPRAIVEFCCEVNQSAEVGLTHSLLLSEALCRSFDPSLSDGELAHGLLDPGRLRTRTAARSRLAAWRARKAVPRTSKGIPAADSASSKRVGAGIRPVENGDLVKRDTGCRQLADPLHHEGRLGGTLQASCHRLGTARLHRLETLLDSTEDGNEPVREPENFRGRAVVRLEPDDSGLPEAALHPD